MMDELVDTFLSESREIVAQANQDLTTLRSDPQSASALDSAFRAFHTLKGSAGLMGFGALESILHASEDLLSQAKKGLEDVPSVVELLIEALDQTEQWLDEVEISGAVPEDVILMAARLEARLRCLIEPSLGPPPAASVAPAQWAAALGGEEWESGGLVAFRYSPDPDCFFRGEDPLSVIKAAPGLRRLHLSPREPWGELALYNPFKCNLVIAGLSSATVAELRDAFRLVFDQVEFADPNTPKKPTGTITASPSAAPRTFRVQAERIDTVASVVEEVVIAKNNLAHLLQTTGRIGDRAIGDALADLDGRVSALHAEITRMRLVPLAPVFGR